MTWHFALAIIAMTKLASFWGCNRLDGSAISARILVAQEHQGQLSLF